MAGVNVAQEFQLYYSPTADYTFVNSMRGSEQKADQGVTNLQHNRMAGFYGCTGVTTTQETWEKAKDEWLVIGMGADYDSSTLLTGTTDAIKSCMWASSQNTSSKKLLNIKFNKKDYTYVRPELISDPLAGMKKIADEFGLTNLQNRADTWAVILSYVLSLSSQKVGTTGTVYIQVKEIDGSGSHRWEPSGKPAVTASGATNSRVNSEHLKTVYDESHTGVGWGVELSGLIPSLKKWYKKISIQNGLEIQNFTYKDGSGSTSSDTVWNDTSNVGYHLEPDLDFSQQVSVNPRLNSDTTETSTPYTYHRFLASQIKFTDDTAWSNNHQLGTSNFETTLRCFNESCTLNHGGLQTIDGSTLKFDRTGYYISGGALQTKYNNYVSTGNIEWKNLIWDSTIYNTKDVKLDSFSSLAGENVYLGGGIPLAYTPAERTGVKVKVNYEVKKLDGSAITAADGSMNIKIELSNKQFSNGGIDAAAGAVSKDSFSTTVSNVSATGSWTSNAFNMGDKSKLWLNAYVVDKQGYNIIIKNIDIQ